MIKQTRGALNFLIASYKAILKHAVVVAAVASAAVFSVANAKTYDLSDDSTFNSASVSIIDDNDGTDTIITKTLNPNYSGTRDIYSLAVQKGNMKFTNGGKLNITQQLVLSGGSLDASNTDIVTRILLMNNYQTSSTPTYTTAAFGNLRITDVAGSVDVKLKADNLYIDRQVISNFETVETKNLYVGLNGSDNYNDPQYIIGEAYFTNLKAENAVFSSEFGLAEIRGVITNYDGDLVKNLSVGPNAYVLLGINPFSTAGRNFIDDAYDRLGWLSDDPVRDGSGYKSILYIYNQNGIKIQNGGGITVDGNVVTPNVEANTVTIGDYSAIVLSKELAENALVSGNNQAAISFADGVTGTVKYSANSRIVIDSSTIKSGSSYNIFGKHYAIPTNGYRGALIVESVNGNFKAYLPPSGYGTGDNNYNTIEGVPSSDVVYVPGNQNPDSGNTNPGVGDNSNAGNAGITTPSTPDNGNKPGNSGNTTKPSLPGLPGTGTIYETFTRGDYTNLGNTLYGLLHNTINDANAKGTGSEFLSAVAGETFTGGKEAEQAARLGQLGGVYQSAFTVSSITDDIVSSRNGVGSSTGSLIVSDNNNGFGIWLSPMVKVASSDGFDSDGLSYGTRVRLTDFAIGADYTLNNGSRLGAYFHTGNGKSTGKGLASHTDGDLKYYGAGLYGKYSYNDFSLLADVSYNKITDDVDTDLGLQSYSRASASVDTYMVKAGLTGQYNFNVNTVSVIPHAGVRYTTLKSDDYSVQANGLYIANVKSDRTKVVSFPVGVTVEKAFNVGQSDWKVKPAVDLGVNFNTGDTDASYKTTFIGANEASLNAEIADSVVYTAGAGLKFSHQNNADIEAGVVYAASENTNDVTFHVNGSYQF